MEKKVKVIECSSGEVLYSCPVTELESAYEYASSVEQMGIEVKVVAPTITQTLADSLKVADSELAEFNQSVASELHDHDGQELTEG